MKIHALTQGIYRNSMKEKTGKQNGFKSQNKGNSTDTVCFNLKNVSFKGDEYGSYEWAMDWNSDKRKAEIDSETKAAIHSLSWFQRKFTKRPKEIAQSQNDKFDREQLMVNTLLHNSVIYQEKVDKAENERIQTEKNIEEIDKKGEKYQKLKNATEIAGAFKIDPNANLDSQIAGYDSEKLLIRNCFIDQVAAEKAGLPAKVPNSVLLYGAIGTGKTTFAHAAASETNCKLVEINPTPEKFSEEVQEILNESRERYLQTEQRTIILVNEVDIHLKEEIGNRKNIALMKNWLDNCAKIPSEDVRNAYAATFFFTTNHPLNVTDEILLRDEKLGQLIALEPAEGENIKAILKFYMKKCDPDKKVVDWEQFDYDKYAEILNPDDKKGAYGNDKLKKMCEYAFASHNYDDSKSFNEYFDEIIKKTRRSITPQRLEQYRSDLAFLCCEEVL